jgi:hypothetical protein
MAVQNRQDKFRFPISKKHIKYENQQKKIWQTPETYFSKIAILKHRSTLFKTFSQIPNRN